MRPILLVFLLLMLTTPLAAQDDDAPAVITITPENAPTLALQMTLSGHDGPIHDLAYSPDGAALFSAASDLSLRHWDPASGEQVEAYYPHNSYVRGVAFGLGGEILMSTSWDQSVRRFAVEEDYALREVPSLEGFRHITEHIDFSANGEWVGFTAGDGAVHLINVVDFSRRTLHQTDSLTFNALVFAPAPLQDERELALVATGFPADALLLLGTDQDAAPLSLDHGHAGSVTGVAFAPLLPEAAADAPWTVATVGDDGTMRLASLAVSLDADDALVADWSPLAVLPQDVPTWLTDVTFNPAGDLLAAVTLEGTLLLWDVSDPAAPMLVFETLASQDALNVVQFSPDGASLAVAGDGRTIHIWASGATGE